MKKSAGYDLWWEKKRISQVFQRVLTTTPRSWLVKNSLRIETHISYLNDEVGKNLSVSSSRGLGLTSLHQRQFKPINKKHSYFIVRLFFLSQKSCIINEQINLLTANDEISRLENLTFLWNWIPRSFVTHASLCNTVLQKQWES